MRVISPGNFDEPKENVFWRAVGRTLREVGFALWTFFPFVVATLTVFVSAFVYWGNTVVDLVVLGFSISATGYLIFGTENGRRWVAWHYAHRRLRKIRSTAFKVAEYSGIGVSKVKTVADKSNPLRLVLTLRWTVGEHPERARELGSRLREALEVESVEYDSSSSKPGFATFVVLLNDPLTETVSLVWDDEPGSV